MTTAVVTKLGGQKMQFVEAGDVVRVEPTDAGDLGQYFAVFSSRYPEPYPIAYLSPSSYAEYLKVVA